MFPFYGRSSVRTSVRFWQYKLYFAIKQHTDKQTTETNRVDCYPAEILHRQKNNIHCISDGSIQRDDQAAVHRGINPLNSGQNRTGDRLKCKKNRLAAGLFLETPETTALSEKDRAEGVK